MLSRSVRGTFVRAPPLRFSPSVIHVHSAYGWSILAPLKALAFVLEASVYQSMGRDDDAISTLLRADEAVTSIHQEDVFLREALRATVFSEMG